MISENFIKKSCDESEEFKALLTILSRINNNVEKGRRFLCLVNHIIDFYIDREDCAVKTPVVYFPLCEDWAQSLCEEFVTLKTSLLLGSLSRENIKRSARDFIDYGSKTKKAEKAFVKNQFDFKRDVMKKLIPLMDQATLAEGQNQKERCLIYSRHITDSFFGNAYHFSKDVVGKDLSDSRSLILLGEDEETLYNTLAEQDYKIPNMFLFPQISHDGRNIRMCMQFNRDTAEAYNSDLDVSIKNIFFFIFSRKPYRLHRIFETKLRFAELIISEQIQNTRDFISFTKEEADYLFSHIEENNQQLTLQLSDSAESMEFRNAFDIILDETGEELKLRNTLATCFTHGSFIRIFNDIVQTNPEINIDYIKYFLQLIYDTHTNNPKFQLELLEWINFDSVAVVLDYFIEDYYKDQLKNFLQQDCGAANITFHSYRDFKTTLVNNQYCNNICENKIIVLSVLNHCTGRHYAIYPNTFDQLKLNPGQRLIFINNDIFKNNLEWYQYRYSEQLYLLLNSDFRRLYIGNSISRPARPSGPLGEPANDDYEVTYNNRTSGKAGCRIIINFVNHQSRTFNDDEMFIYKVYDDIGISSLSDIMRIYDDHSKLQLQPITDFYDALNTIVDKVSQSSGREEVIIRNDARYDLSEEERNSEREMWKILLEHKVYDGTTQEVYDKIMQPLDRNQRVQLNTFYNWLDRDNTSILPRSRRMQKRLLEEYLEIDPLYTKLLRHRKSRTCSTTEQKNLIYRSFLTSCFLDPKSIDSLECLSAEVRDYLDIRDPDDISAIIDLIKEETFELQQVEIITINHNI